ncbi:MAG: AmmeMemoRadiSam system protein A [Phycisphaeraceae bacterium]
MSDSINNLNALSPDDRRQLLAIARDSVSHGLSHRHALPVDPAQFSLPLQAVRASFVTLRIESELRGCIGMLSATRPLVEDVARNAFAAAFRDTRFKPVAEYEYHLLNYHLSILSPSELMTVTSQDDLLAQLRPGVDGLIIEEVPRRATFLPDVWQTLPEPEQFLAHLKQKAGFDADYWSDRIQCWRYTTESIE